MRGRTHAAPHIASLMAGYNFFSPRRGQPSRMMTTELFRAAEHDRRLPKIGMAAC
jgi:hypothetical protein